MVMVMVMVALLLKVKVTDEEVGRKLSQMKEKEKKRIEDLCSKVASPQNPAIVISLPKNTINDDIYFPHLSS